MAVSLRIQRLLGLYGRVKIISVLTFLPLTCYCVLFILPVRNLILSPYLEYAWKNVETSELLRLRGVGREVPTGFFNKVSCEVIRPPAISKKDVNVSGILTYPQFKSPEFSEKVLRNQHGRYLPALNFTQKLDYLYLYLVMADALNSVGVQHFLVAGSLLGLVRHGGFVPWDDDLDISVRADTWVSVKQTLSCIDGFNLMRESNFHWKFHYVGRKYPFVDIFFYDMDQTYAWALTQYTRITYIYPIKLVFPLTEAVFEGLKVPVPADGLNLAKRIYEYDVCKAFKSHIDMRNKTLVAMYPEGYSLTSLACQDLSYMYRMQHFKGS